MLLNGKEIPFDFYSAKTAARYEEALQAIGEKSPQKRGRAYRSRLPVSARQQSRFLKLCLAPRPPGRSWVTTRDCPHAWTLWMRSTARCRASLRRCRPVLPSTGRTASYCLGKSRR